MNADAWQPWCRPLWFGEERFDVGLNVALVY